MIPEIILFATSEFVWEEEAIRGKDAVGISAGQNYLFDHVSVSWGRDGTVDINGSGVDNITLQDCIVAQGLHSHSTGGLMQSGKTSVIRCLYTDNHTRNPKVKGG